MSIVPKWPFVVGALVIGLAAGAWIDHMVVSLRISEIKLTDATAITQASQVALDDMRLGAKEMKEAAAGGKSENDAILTLLATIRRNQKNAPPPALPDDCRPGPVRLRNLAETAAAADRAAARPVPGK